MDNTSRTEQQVIAKQAAISYLDRRLNELKEKRNQIDGQKRTESKSLRDHKVATWWHSHPDITTDHLALRSTWLFWLALVVFILIVSRVSRFTDFVMQRYRSTNFGSPQDLALFLGVAAVAFCALCIAFIVFYYVFFLIPFVEIPKRQLQRRQRELNERRMTIAHQAEQEATREIEAKHASALAEIDQEIAETEAQIGRLKHDLDRLAMEV